VSENGPDIGDLPTVKDETPPGGTCPGCGGPPDHGTDACVSNAPTREAGQSSAPTGASLPAIDGYRVLRKLGEGGMGAVYEAIEEKLSRRVALKVLSAQIAGAGSARERFVREAWIAGKLNHPNLVKVYDRGECNGLSWFSMELVEGGSLHDVVRKLRKSGRDETWNLKAGTRDYFTWAIGHVIEAARGLDHAHRNGIVHRDIKPMNLLLGRDPVTVKVADFGLAIDEDAIRLTRTGAVMGTIAYMAPEQIRGRKKEIDARTDVYALGVTLFEMLTLELPYVAGTQEMYLSSVLTEQARRPSRVNRSLSRDLDTVIGKALEKDPRDRYESAAAFAGDLENVLNFRPLHARPPSVPTRLAKWARRRPVHAALAAILVVSVPTVTLLGVRAAKQQRALARVEMQRLWDEARALGREDRPSEALAPLTALLERDPDHVEALKARSLNRLSLALKEDDLGRRLEWMEPALEDAGRVISLEPEASWPYRVRAFMLERIGRREEAARDEASAAQRRGEVLTPTELEIEGLLALQAGEHRAAEERFSEAIRRAPGMAQPYMKRAAAYEKLGELQRAMADWQVAAAMMPDDVVPRQNLGRLAAMAGDLESSAAYYGEAVRIAPDNAMVHAGLADMHVRRGVENATAGESEKARAEFREAQREARIAIDRDARLAWARVNLGAAIIEETRLDDAPDAAKVREALADYEEAVRLKEQQKADPSEPDYAAALVNLCDGMIQLRDPEGALAACLRATEAYPDQADVFYNMAGAYILAGRTDDALAALEKDLALGDNDHEYLAADDWFASLRSDPRFLDLLERMKKAAAGR